MTTIVVVQKAGQICIAADSQSTFGDTRLSAQFDAAPEKIFFSHDSFFGISGSAAHDLVLQAALTRHKHLDFSSRPAIFESFRKLHPKLKEEFYLKPEEEEDDPYESSQMTALIANRHGIFGVFSMREVYQFRNYWAIGSGSDFALGAMAALFHDPALDASRIAQLGVETGCQLDINSSLPLNLYTLPQQD